ncbi:ABC transporter permease [Rhabdothermincola salaria]|uniref:ABC transporter permease n=1 Tax=Rhabdothermincola salaria TaxID=2903142 RepID=UPI001E3831E6|nr:iron ABC transporter permease [Rhabdothermincola salaria]MCD9624039.1 iron ABC transporter permease [Rhabdothermincola salaria]
MVGALVATVVAVSPIVYLVIRATDQGWGAFLDTLWRSRTLELTLRSLWLAAVVTTLCLVIGVGMAWLVTRTDIPGRRVVQVLVGLPLALPSYVAAWSWLGFRPDLAGMSGSVLVLTTISYPYVYLPVMAALRRCDPALEDVARTLGSRRLTVFWRTTLPQIRTAAVGGGLLVGLYVMSDFGAVATMRHEVLTYTIYQSYRASFDRTPAAVLGVLLAVLTITIVLIESRYRHRHGAARIGAGAVRPQPVLRLGAWRWPALAVPVALVGFSLGVPLWGMVRWWSRGTSRADTSQVVDAAGNTLLVGALGALLVVVLALPVALLAVRHQGRLSKVASSAAYTAHALPGVVVGLAMVFLAIRVVPSLYQELPVLIVAYAVLFMSLALGSIQAAVAQIPPGLEDVARSLGSSVWGVWRRVVLRLAAPGIAAAATLVFLTVMKELPATLFLRPTGFDTLATRLWDATSSVSYAAAAPYAVLIVVLAALPTAVLSAVGDRRSRE